MRPATPAAVQATRLPTFRGLAGSASWVDFFLLDMFSSRCWGPWCRAGHIARPLPGEHTYLSRPRHLQAIRGEILTFPEALAGAPAFCVPRPHRAIIGAFNRPFARASICPRSSGPITIGRLRSPTGARGETAMHVEMRPIGSIRPYENNPRHNDGAVDAVAASIREFGFRQPIVVDEAGVI